MKNRIILVVIALSVFAASAFAGDCVEIKKKQYCEVQQVEPVALPAIPYPPAPPTVVVVQQPQPPCVPPSGWVQLPNGALYCQPPIQQVPMQVVNRGPSLGDVMVTSFSAEVGANIADALFRNVLRHDVVYVERRGGRWGH